MLESLFRPLRMMLAAVLCITALAFSATHYTVGTASDFPDVQTALANLVPLQDDVVLHVRMGFSGYNESMDAELTTAEANGFVLDILLIDNTHTTSTYYFDEDLEYRVNYQGDLEEAIEYTEGGQFTARKVNYPGGSPGSEYYIKNNLGSTVTMTDESGTASGDYFEYHAYGNQEREQVTASAPVTHSFTGKEFDYIGEVSYGDGGGLYHFGARYYDADIGMWLSVDPEFETYSPYTFAANNPLTFKDADGRSVYTKAGKVLYKFIKTGDAASAFADNIQDAAVLFGSNATLGGRVLAGISLASEFLPVSVGDIKDGYKIARMVSQKAKKLELKLPETADKAVAAKGVIYKRTNPKTGEEYVGQAKSPERFEKRKLEHNKDKGVEHEFEILGKAEPGKNLDVLEESMIRKHGGIQKEGGTLANKRHQMTEKKYRAAGGKE